MKIKLSNEYYIEQEPLNFILRRKTTSYGTGKNQYEEPKLVTKDCGYYGSLGEAIKGYFRQAIADKTADFDGSMEEYVKRVENIVDNAVTEIKRLNKWQKEM